MKAIVYEKYGTADVLHLKELTKPIPKDDEVLIKIHATSVSAADWRLRKADPFLARLFNGLFKPKRVNVLGIEVSGTIELTGKNVHHFKQGDTVFAYCGFSFGGYAEYICLKSTAIIAHKPEHLSFEEAATTPLGALTALFFLKKAKVSPGKKILIYGASGSVGTFAVQLAKHFGAEVTAMCSNKNIELVKSIGADRVFDYRIMEVNMLNEKFDGIVDAVGKMDRAIASTLLITNGKFVSVKSQTSFTKDDLVFIKELVEAKKLISVIDKIYNLEDIREAHRYVEQFRKRGNVAIRINE